MPLIAVPTSSDGFARVPARYKPWSRTGLDFSTCPLPMQRRPCISRKRQISPEGAKVFVDKLEPALAGTFRLLKTGPKGSIRDTGQRALGVSDCHQTIIRTIFGLERRVDMKLSTQIKPISYLKAHAAEIVRTLSAQGGPLIITQNGEAKAVIQDLASYEQAQETMALLKMLALGTRQIEEGKVQPAGDVIRRLRDRSTSR
jgi:prevent-host-death family protein